MKKEELAVKIFRDGYNCAQSMIYSFADDLGIDKSLALKLACGFGGGLGRKEKVCGAVTGGILVLGLIFGRGEDEDKLKQEETFYHVRDFIDQFESINGTIDCRSLIDNIDLLTEEGQNKFIKLNMINKCYEYVTSANRIIQKFLK